MYGMHIFRFKAYVGISKFNTRKLIMPFKTHCAKEHDEITEDRRNNNPGKPDSIDVIHFTKAQK